MTRSRHDYLWIYIPIALLVLGAFVYFLISSFNPGYVKVKYREDKVDISSDYFQPLDKSDATVGGAWYDFSNLYMVIKLNDTYYHYCSLPIDTWSSFRSSPSLYGYYQEEIKGNYDCRLNPVPSYN